MVDVADVNRVAGLAAESQRLEAVDQELTALGVTGVSAVQPEPARS